MIEKIKACRICDNTNLVLLLNLGEQTLTGVFPKTKTEKITSGPLELVECVGHKGEDVCGLVQLHHVYDNKEMYGMNYGYRSGLNQSMVRHLQSIVRKITERITLYKDDLIIDIGSNDCTLLKSYPSDKGLVLVGIDASGEKFKKYYPDHIQLIPDFFLGATIKKHFQNKRAKVITSIAMFYDLEKPFEFVKQINETLDDDGIWVFEQSYLPMMLSTSAYDTICHEHAEYYALKQIKWMLDKAGLKIVDVELNDTNGGSFQVTAAKKNSNLKPNEQKMEELLKKEEEMRLNDFSAYQKFEGNIERHKRDLQQLVHQINNSGKKIFGYGASTKGNVILQYCGFTAKDIPYIAEVNEDKFGSFTPATHIPIISEKEAKALKPDYLLVLPWHFKEGILKREKEFLQSGGKFIFPLPQIEII